MKLSILDPGGIGLARGSPLKATVQGVARGMFQNVDGGLQAFYRGRVLSYVGIKARLQDGKPMDLLGGGESGRRSVSTPLVRRTSGRATVRAVVAGPRVLVRTRRLKAEGKRGLGVSMGKGGVGGKTKGRSAPFKELTTGRPRGDGAGKGMKAQGHARGRGGAFMEKKRGIAPAGHRSTRGESSLIKRPRGPGK